MPNTPSASARLIANMSIRQVDLLERIDSIERGIDAMLSRKLRDLLSILTGDSQTPKTAAFAAVMQSTLGDVKIMLRKQFKELLMRSHWSVVDAVWKSIPPRVFEFLVPIDSQHEWYKPERVGRIEFGYGRMTLVYEDDRKPFGVPADLLAKRELTDEEKEQIRQDVLFPPPSQAEVAQILGLGRHRIEPTGTTYETWENRFDGLSRLIQDKKLAFNELAYGYTQGENIEQLKKRLEPIVGGVKASARRIARTEGSRIAEHLQRRTWDGLGDMMIGAQIHAVLDERTRPEHATRNGTIYYRQPKPGQKSIGELPDLPDAPNCRCMAIPVLAPPKELANDPTIKAAFRSSGGSGDPDTYDQWFKSATPAKRKMVVGVGRYSEIEKQLGERREPRWSDFIDAEGSLLNLDALRNEGPIAKAARVKLIDDTMKARRTALRQVSRTGFERPSRKKGNGLQPTLSGVQFTGRVDLQPEGLDQEDLEEVIDNYLPGGTPKDLFSLVGAPDGSRVTVREGQLGLVAETIYQANGRTMTSRRIVMRGPGGKVILLNDKIALSPTGEHFGLDVFRRQVDTAIAFGVDRIRCTAIRSSNDNGYYTWARFGYEPVGIKPQVSVPDTMLTPDGREWWKVNGNDFEGVFDLSHGSRSRQVFDLYYGKCMKERNQKLQE